MQQAPPRSDGLPNELSPSILLWMPAGDDLTIITFCLSTAISFLGLLVSALGWKHPIFIWMLSSLSLIFTSAGLGWPWIKNANPSIEPYAIAIATNPSSWFVSFLILISSFVFVGKQKVLLRQEIKDVKERSLKPQANSLVKGIRIFTKSGADGFPENTFSNGMVRRFFAVYLKNDGDGWLTGCRLEVESITPGTALLTPPHGHRIIAPSCDLPSPGMERQIILIGYNRVPSPAEVYQQVYNDGPTIFFSSPGAWNGGAYTIISPDHPVILRLRAYAEESGPHQLDIKVWVDQGRLLSAVLV